MPEFFFNSLMTLRYTKDNAIFCRISKTDQIGRHEPSNKTSLELRQIAVNFIIQLPAVPSHYCRKKTSRKYLSSEFEINLFCIEFLSKIKSVTEKPLNYVSKFLNRSYKLPLTKKDKCVICEPRKDKDFEDTEKSAQAYKEHICLKDICKEEFLKNQKKGLEEYKFLCVSFECSVRRMEIIDFLITQENTLFTT